MYEILKIGSRWLLQNAERGRVIFCERRFVEHVSNVLITGTLETCPTISQHSLLPIRMTLSNRELRMKTLLLLRHGKSSWKNCELPDHDRPLKKRGREAAKRMGRLLFELSLMPDQILTSTALRARDTASLAAESLTTTDAKFSGEILAVPTLYHAEPPTFVAIVSRVSNLFDRVLVVGHNPGLEDWLARLTHSDAIFPTGAMCHIELPIDSWLDLSLDMRGELRGLWRPKELK